ERGVRGEDLRVEDLARVMAAREMQDRGETGAVQSDVGQRGEKRAARPGAVLSGGKVVDHLRDTPGAHDREREVENVERLDVPGVPLADPVGDVREQRQ